MRIEVHGRAAHSSTPWLGDNAVLKAVDVFRAIESLPFSRESSELFDRPSINLGRIQGGDALNKVPDSCTMAVDIRYLPGQDPAEILDQVRAIPEVEVTRTFIHPPVAVSRTNPYVRALRDAVSARGRRRDDERRAATARPTRRRSWQRGSRRSSSGRPGTGHHGPEEWVSLSRSRATGGRWPISSGRCRCGSTRVTRPSRACERSRGASREADPRHASAVRCWRYGLGALVVVAFTATTTAVAGLLQFNDFAKDLVAEPADQARQRDDRQSRQPADAAVDRVRPPCRRAVQRRPHRHDDARAPGPELVDDQRDLGAARPQGRDPPGRSGLDLEAERRVLGRRAEPADARSSGTRCSRACRSTTSSTSTSGASRTSWTRSGACTPTSTTATTTTPRSPTTRASTSSPAIRSCAATTRRKPARSRSCASGTPTSDIVRNARQQDFLRWAKEQYSPRRSLIANRDRLLKIFGAHTQTDHNLHTDDGLINLFNLIVFSSGHTIKQIPFPAISCRGPAPGGAAVPCYVTANAAPRLRAFHEFMTPTRASAAPPGGWRRLAAQAGARPAPPRASTVRRRGRRQGPGVRTRRHRDSDLLPAPDRDRVELLHARTATAPPRSRPPTRTRAHT